MDDAALVERARRGDTSAFAAIYDRYADRLHTYAWSLLHDRDEASDVVSETFVGAMSRLDQLRDPAALRPWLYAIARHEAFRRSKQRGRMQLTDKPLEYETIEPEIELDATKVAALVWDAAPGLNERDREVLELHYRHGLSGDELADALGVTVEQSYVVLSRLRDQLDRTLGAYLVARQGRADCDELATLLAPWDGTFSPLWRKRVSRHVDDCDTCKRRRKLAMAPESIASASPMLTAPVELREAVLAQIAGLGGAVVGSWVADGRGFPRHARNKKSLVLLGVCAALLVASIVGLGVAIASDDSETTVVLEPPATSTSTTTSTTTSTSTTTTTTPTTTTTTTPTTTTRPTTTSRPTPTTLPPITFGAVGLSPSTIVEYASPSFTSACTLVPNEQVYSTATAKIDDDTVTSVTARVSGPTTQPTFIFSKVSPRQWTATIGGFGPTEIVGGTVGSPTIALPFTITATSDDGRSTSFTTSINLRNCF